MILWIVLFVLVLAISFVLALKSMRDYQEIPSQLGGDFSLFLVRNTKGLNEHFFNSLHSDLLQSGLNISIERLFKGKESALVLFGPKSLLAKYKQLFNLLELEDYTDCEIDKVVTWEVGLKLSQQPTDDSYESVFKNLPELLDSEQFWWQMILWVKKEDSDFFQTQIRAVVYAQDQFRRKELTQKMQNLSPDRFVKLPKAYSNAQIIDFYKKRIFPFKGKKQKINNREIIQLISLS